MKTMLPSSPDLRVLAKAVKDEVVERVLDKMQEQSLSLLESVWESLLEHRKQDSVRFQNIEDELKSLRKECTEKTSEIQELRRGLKEIHGELKEVENRLKGDVSAFVGKEIGSQLGASNERLKVLIGALPLPKVTVENKAPVINVPKQDSPTINVAAPTVNLPKDSITVNVESKPSVVNVNPKITIPKQASPTINVNPELHPEIHVDTFRKGKVTKTIEYEKGKPVRIIEEAE